MAATKAKPSTPQLVAAKPASSWAAWLVVAIAALFGVLGLIDVAAEVLYDFKGSRATGQVLEFHAMSSRSHSIEATVMAAPAGVAPFRWQVQDTLGLHDWKVGESAPLLCAHIHADHVSCVLDSYADRYLFSGVMLLFGLGIAGFGATRLLRRKVATGAGASAAGA
jgi:hypothetical protein